MTEVQSTGPELVIGLVTPVGTDTTGLASAVAGRLSDYDYTPNILKLSHVLQSPEPAGEGEDERVRRLISAGDEFCREHATDDRPDGDPAALAKLSIAEIRKSRLRLFRQDGLTAPAAELGFGRGRTAYVLHSLKRPAEIVLLREVYGEQFVLIGSQQSAAIREASLLQRHLSVSGPDEKARVVAELIAMDADEKDAIGQKVNEAYPLADFFLRDNDVSRVVDLLFGQPIEPTIGEFAMYIARASRARSLAASRKVGAAIVVDGAVVSTGYNDPPEGHVPDVLEGMDTSERLKRANVLDTLRRLESAGLMTSGMQEMSEDDLIEQASNALKGGQLLSVIEYQRAVHAEAKAIDDATVRGISPEGGSLYVTTHPCHLCYKHALSVRIKTVEFIEPYAKSRATAMYPEGSADRLVPYVGVAPRRYVEIFDARPAFVSESDGTFKEINKRVAQPLLRDVRDDADRDERERLAVSQLKEKYQ